MKHDPRCFAVAVQWLPLGPVVQEDGMTWDEAWEAVAGYKTARRAPHRVAFAIMVPR